MIALRGISVLAAAAVVATAPVWAQEAPRQLTIDRAENLAIARRINELGYPESVREAMFFGAAAQMMSQVKVCLPHRRNCARN